MKTIKRCPGFDPEKCPACGCDGVEMWEQDGRIYAREACPSHDMHNIVDKTPKEEE